MKKTDKDFGDIFSSLIQPALVCEAENKIIAANYAAEGFFGLSANILTKQNLENIIAFGSPALRMVERILQNHAPISEYRILLDLIGSDADNRASKIVDIFASPLIGQNGRVLLLFLERSRAEKIDRQLISRNAVRSVSGLAAMLAHEIKNPLSGIRGAAQLLEQSVKGDDVNLARLIRDETDRIVALLEKVDIFGDERIYNQEAVNIHIILERVKLLLKNAEAKNIEFIEEYDPSLPPVLGNSDKLIQVFLNIIKNAAEALKGINNPQIKISTSYKPGIRLSMAGVKKSYSLPLEIRIEDNGKGIDPDILQNIFDPFVTTKPNGKGLGLALVAKIIADHGGIVDVESKRGKTVFLILLPLAEEKGDNIASENNLTVNNYE